MNPLNGIYQELVQAIELYCSQRRRIGNSDGAYAAATELRRVFKSALPRLAAKLEDTVPDLIYAERIISFGVKGTSREDIRVIWEMYFVEGESAEKMACIMKYTPATVYRRAGNFPTIIANQLWEKHDSLVNLPHSIVIQPTTLEQRWQRLFREKYSLTPKQSEVLLAFCQQRDMGRMAIAAKLYISLNTLKKHIGNIIHAMNTSSMNEAVYKAQTLLEDDPNRGI